MSPRLVLGAVAIAAAISSPAFSQTIRQSQQQTPRGAYFVAGYSSQGNNGYWVTDFYRTIGPQFLFSARRALNTVSGQEQIQFIDEADCPAIATVLESLNGLSMPEVRIRNLSRQEGVVPYYPAPPTMNMDATGYAIWANGVQAEGSFAELNASAISGPIYGWGSFADELLRPCWQSPGSAVPDRAD